MKTMMSLLPRVIAVVGVAAPWLAVAGCKEKGPSYEILTLEGKVDAIERQANETGLITVRYYSDRHETELSGTGKVTEETQIMINGVASKLSDVREGDRVRGEVRIEKQGDRRTQVALKIVINRPEPVGGD